MDELISRQAVIQALYDGAYLSLEKRNALANRIDRIPTAEPNDEEAFEAGYTKAQMELKDAYKPKKGKWISDSKQRLGQVVKIDDDGCPTDSCHCSVCGDWLTASDEYAVRGRYCPNCGARMEE